MAMRSPHTNPSYGQTWRPSLTTNHGGGGCLGDASGILFPAALRRLRMDDVVNRLARELSDAIAAAVAEDARIEACRERARAAGFEMKVSLEAVIGFMNRTAPGALTKVGTVPQKAARAAER